MPESTMPTSSVSRDITETQESALTTQPAAQHPDDAAVDALSALMKAKLAKQRAKGYGGWNDTECTQQHLTNLLRAHVDKGDPVDVANFCAFLSARCEGIAQAAPAAVAGPSEMHEALCPALTGGHCTCERSDPAVEKAWARFCGVIGDGPDAPYPGMISAFERYYSQSFTDKDWRTEASVWAAAWKQAMLAAAPATQAEHNDILYLIRRLLSNQHTLSFAEFLSDLEEIYKRATLATETGSDVEISSGADVGPDSDLRAHDGGAA